MITHRPLGVSDLPMLQKALDQDTFEHAGIPQYTMDNAYSEVYEDEAGPIGVLRCTKTLRMVSVWCDNSDKKRNATSTIAAVKAVVERAKASGFVDVIFETDNEGLSVFCRTLGFVPSGNTMVLHV